MQASQEPSDTPAPSGNTDADVEPGDATEKSVESLAAHDAEIVDWEGPSDHEHPRNWTARAKLTHVLLVSGFTLYS